jgi:23S rRNA U2552 (ribose-2'-O)-methylase RlmE/FtsJ
MLKLNQICSIYNTDKNNYHSYVDGIYEELFKTYRNSALNVLEIGVDNGASVMMWREYFTNAIITSIDIKDCPQIAGRDRINHIVADAYSYDIVNSFNDRTFDIIIDDGNHTLPSITFVVKEYTKKLTKNGLLIIEDFQDFNWTNIIKREVSEIFKSEVYDLRSLRGRYDDIAMVISRV